MGVHRKIQFLGGGSRNTNIDLRYGLAKKREEASF